MPEKQGKAGRRVPRVAAGPLAQPSLAKTASAAPAQEGWESRHAEMRCVHPPGCTYCGWCGLRTPSIEDSIMLATNYHHGQTDKAGLPYILHPLRVMGMFVSPEDHDARTVAVLHDIVEDTEVTLEMLRDQGYPQTVLDAIDAVTRRPGEPYATYYIERVKQNPLGRRVKLADLCDNLNPNRVSTRELPPDVYSRYVLAKCALLDFATGSVNDSPSTEPECTSTASQEDQCRNS